MEGTRITHPHPRENTCTRRTADPLNEGLWVRQGQKVADKRPSPFEPRVLFLTVGPVTHIKLIKADTCVRHAVIESRDTAPFKASLYGF